MKLSEKTNTYLQIIIITFIVVFILIPKGHIMHISPHIRDVLWLVFIACGILLAIYYLQQGDNKYMPKKNPKKNPAPLIEGFENARVLRFESNRIGDLDNMVLHRADGSEVRLHFPPHTAQKVMHIVQVNKQVQFKAGGIHKHSPDGKIILHLHTVKSYETQEEFQVEEMPPPRPSVGKEISLEGQIKQYKLDENGMVSGFILQNYLVEIPPHLTNSLVPLLKDAKIISLKGYLRSTNYGFVNTTGLEIVKPYSIRIDETDYIL
jgi:hypothetical protein